MNEWILSINLVGIVLTATLKFEMLIQLESVIISTTSFFSHFFLALSLFLFSTTLLTSLPPVVPKNGYRITQMPTNIAVIKYTTLASLFIQVVLFRLLYMCMGMGMWVCCICMVQTPFGVFVWVGLLVCFQIYILYEHLS